MMRSMSSTIIAAPFEEPDSASVRTGSTWVEAARYFVASLAALALDAALLWVGATALALPVWLAGAAGYAAGLVLVYALSVRWVFPQRAVADRRREFVVFAVLGLLGLFVNSATLVAATSCGLPLLAAKALAAAVGFCANFASRKALLFTARAPGAAA